MSTDSINNTSQNKNSRTLEIKGTKGDDRIEFGVETLSDTNGSVQKKHYYEVNGQRTYYDPGQYDRVKINGKDGNDYINTAHLELSQLESGGHQVKIRGGRGDDHIIGSRYHDKIRGGRGNDIIEGGYGNDHIRGGRGDDQIKAGYGDDTVRAGRGNDIIEGGYGNDTLRGNQGDDQVDGGYGDDRLYGGQGNDQLTGGYGNDWLYGRSGNDELDGGYGKNYLDGGPGNDHLQTEPGWSTVNPSNGPDPYLNTAYGPWGNSPYNYQYGSGYHVYPNLNSGWGGGYAASYYQMASSNNWTQSGNFYYPQGLATKNA